MLTFTRTSIFGKHVRTSLVNGMRLLTSNSFSLINHEELQPTQPAKLRGRPFLPDGDKSSFPQYLDGPRKDFPLALKAEANHSLDDWGKLCRKEIDENLLKYGAILFRQLPIDSAEDFQTLLKSIGFPAMSYDGGSGHRDSIAEQIYYASEEPPEYSIELHNEMSYYPVYNKKVNNLCQVE